MSFETLLGIPFIGDIAPWLWVAFVIVLAYVITVITPQIFQSKTYRRQEYIMSPAEKRLFMSLNQALGKNYLILTKVRIADVLTPTRAKKDRKWWRSFVKISSKHVDFLVCSKPDYRILVAIELDDRSHEKKDRRKRDKFVNKAFKDADVPLHRLPVQKHYDSESLNQLSTEVESQRKLHQ